MAMALSSAGLAACGGDGGLVPSNATPSRAFALWRPGPTDTCTQEQHDAYAVVGPDGKAYPTWHPPTGPGGCSFGHEHGRDPRESDLYGEAGGLPFGYANEVLAAADPANARDEDHFGHKVEWENDLEMEFGGAGGAVFRKTCDVLTKLHQGTHSKDAFTNNVHELIYHIDCDDGTELHVTMLAAIGEPGEFRRSCDRDVAIAAGAPTPANSPAGGGFRAIPDRTCVEEHLLVAAGEQSNTGAALHETWETSNRVRRADGHTLAFFNPYYQVRRPSRFYDPAIHPTVGRPISVCYEITATGEAAHGGPCDAATEGGTIAGITYDDPRSPFNGAHRFVDINANRISNANGPEVWYTDAYGQNGRPEPFPNSIRQRIAVGETDAGVDDGGPVIGDDRDYTGPGTRAPN
jgi:hypothetical protein